MKMKIRKSFKITSSLRMTTLSNCRMVRLKMTLYNLRILNCLKRYPRISKDLKLSPRMSKYLKLKKYKIKNLSKYLTLTLHRRKYLKLNRIQFLKSYLKLSRIPFLKKYQIPKL